MSAVDSFTSYRMITHANSLITFTN